MHEDEFSIQIQHKSENYLINIKFDSNLHINLHSKTELKWWKGTFSPSYVEDLTIKSSGNSLKTKEFFSILSESLTKGHMDLLTHSDLQKLKLGKENIPDFQNQKRYLIIKTILHSKQVNFPLSLSMQDLENVETLKSHLRQLKTQLKEMKKNKSEYHNNILDQNSQNSLEDLHEEAFFLTENKQVGVEKNGAVQLDELIKGKCELEEEIEFTRKNYQQQIRRLQTEIQIKQKQMTQFQGKLQFYQQEIKNKPDKLKEFILKMAEQSQKDIKDQKQIVTKQDKLIQKMLSEITIFNRNDRKNTTNIQQLESKLEQTIKKTPKIHIVERLHCGTKNTNRNQSVPLKNAFRSRNVSPLYQKEENSDIYAKNLTKQQALGRLKGPFQRGSPQRSEDICRIAKQQRNGGEGAMSQLKNLLKLCKN